MKTPPFPKKEILEIRDFICERCRVQPTSETDRVCETCKAIGKGAEMVVESEFWSGVRKTLGGTKRYFFG